MSAFNDLLLNNPEDLSDDHLEILLREFEKALIGSYGIEDTLKEHYFALIWEAEQRGYSFIKGIWSRPPQSFFESLYARLQKFFVK